MIGYSLYFYPVIPIYNVMPGLVPGIYVFL